MVCSITTTYEYVFPFHTLCQFICLLLPNYLATVTILSGFHICMQSNRCTNNSNNNNSYDAKFLYKYSLILLCGSINMFLLLVFFFVQFIYEKQSNSTSTISIVHQIANV